MNRIPVCMVLLGLAAALICLSGTSAAEKSPFAPVPLLPQRMNLLERFPVARVGLDDASRGDVPMDSSVHFAGGWYQPSKTEDGQVYRWLGPRAGVVDIALLESEALNLSIGLAAPRDDRIPPVHVRFHWNGEFAGAIDLGGSAQTVKMAVPAGLTRAGLNRLEVFPSFWVNASRLAGGSSTSNVSVNMFRLAIARQEGAPARIDAQYPAAQADGSVLQYANSVITYAARIESGTRLNVSGRWLVESGAAPAEAVVLVRDNSSKTEIVLRSNSSGAAINFTAEADLETFAGRFVEISTVVRQTEEEKTRPPSVSWNNMMLTGPGRGIEESPTVPLSRTQRPNVVMVVFDTLRADYTEPYGATHVRTPNFTRLAGRGTTFTNAFAHSSWTRPSIATMMTSLHETRHGVVTIGHKLPAELPYLPELLRDSGYKTVGLSMNAHISIDWRFDRGFESFHHLGKQHEQLLRANPSPGAYLNALWDGYIAPETDGDAPFFVYIHELDPHGPYVPRPPFDTMYPSPYSGQPKIEADHINLVRLGLTELAAQDIAHLETRYRGEVSFVDGVLGAIMTRLEAEGFADNTLLIVTSDHGEEFGEHGGIGHMVTLYDEMLRVPLIWSWPGRVRSARVASAIGLVDVAPTLLNLLGLPVPQGVEGRDLSAWLRSESPAWDYPILAQLTGNPERVRRAVHWAGWKLCVREFGPESDYELFDTAADPREVTNQWIAQRETGLALKQMMDWYAHANPVSTVAATNSVNMDTLDPELVEGLRNLGYVQ